MPTDRVGDAAAAPATAQPAAAPGDDRARPIVVGLGASAGGMQALTRFFEHMPPSTGMCFVVVIHLSPVHESHAADILQRSTRMPVRQVAETVAVEAGVVYVIPPGRALTMDDGNLVLRDAERPHGTNVAIDTFFRDLAEAHGPRAVCVVLSGTGTDGSVGLTRVKERGGVTFVQEPADALHQGMPLAAIATGMADFVMPADRMPPRLVQLAANADTIRLPGEGAAATGTRKNDAGDDAAGESALTEIMALLRTRTHHDFRHYKRPTVLRRLERRMQVTGVPTLQAYRDHLRDHPEETSALLQDMLISVTNFFRDPQSYAALERQALRGMGASHPDGLRVWIVGCASGEEAYSIAMLLTELGDDAASATNYQLFASDIDDRALARARSGVYPGSIAADVDPIRLRTFFTPEGDHYRVVKSLRERVLFAHHNVLRDPPFSRVDLIVCRNLLIYLDASAQAAVLDIFRFALRPSGVLFLGSSETADGAPGLFAAIDKKHRLYRLRADLTSTRPPPMALDVRGQAVRESGGRDTATQRPMPYADLHRRARDAVAPPSVLVDSQHEILHVVGDVAGFLQVPQGTPSRHLLDKTHPSLRLSLRAALFQARPAAVDESRPVTLEAARGDDRVRISVRPVRDSGNLPELLLVSFEEILGTGTGTGTGTGEIPVGSVTEQVVHELEDEKRWLQRQLQGVIEHAEASTEELMSSNEELQALNEELRSASEELETSREELQSTNEELTTVNAELAAKVEETGRINDDLQNLINANDIATVFVDREMRIKRYTPRATTLFNLIPSDIGRSLAHITHRLDYAALIDDAQSAFNTLRLVEREIDGDGRHFVARLQPYRTVDDKIDGAILSFVDVTALRRSQLEASARAEQLRLAAETTRDFAILTTDPDGLVTSWNIGAERLYGCPAEQALGRSIAEFYPDEDRADGIPERQLEQAAEQGRSEDECWQRRRDGSVFYCSGVTTRLDDRSGFAKIARDLTGSKQASLARDYQLSREQAGRRDAEATMESKELFLAVMSHELKQPLNLIHLNAELLSRLPEVQQQPTAKRAAQLIRQTVAGQARIIDDLLDLSRVRTGKLTLDPVPVDWGDAVRRIVDALRPEADAQGVELRFDSVPQSLVSMFDPVRADQVVWNLLHNALKFTPRGGWVKASLTADDGSALLAVADSGRGIAADFIDNVFEMFSQERGSRGRRDDGMGIGLALVRELVVAHGGRVGVRSDGPGRGAEFSIWIPLHDEQPGNAAPVADASVLNGLRLLVVDDSTDAADSFGMLLQMSGAEVDCAGSGAQALEMLATNRYDLLLSDISMPGMDGHELVAALRGSSGANAGIRAIACSGYGRAQDETRAIEAGFDALVSKPASLEQVEQAVARLPVTRRQAPVATQDGD